MHNAVKIIQPVPPGLDWGRDVSFSNVRGNRRVMIGWMNNWDYANSLPTPPWRSPMSPVREVELATLDGFPRLVQRPVLPAAAEKPTLTIEDMELNGSVLPLSDVAALS